LKFTFGFDVPGLADGDEMSTRSRPPHEVGAYVVSPAEFFEWHDFLHSPDMASATSAGSTLVAVSVGTDAFDERKRSTSLK
jgi:hypothetical protein